MEIVAGDARRWDRQLELDGTALGIRRRVFLAKQMPTTRSGCFRETTTSASSRTRSRRKILTLSMTPMSKISISGRFAVLSFQAAANWAAFESNQDVSKRITCTSSFKHHLNVSLFQVFSMSQAVSLMSLEGSTTSDTGEEIRSVVCIKVRATSSFSCCSLRTPL